MSKIVRTVANFLILFIFTYGLYVIMHGHVTPGGGFQGGAVFASGIALLIVAFGAKSVHRKLKEHQLSVLESSGALLFIALAFAGITTVFFYNALVGSSFFGNIPPVGANPGDIWTGGLIPLMNVAVGMKVIAGLGSILLVMSLITSGATEVEE